MGRFKWTVVEQLFRRLTLHTAPLLCHSSATITYCCIIKSWTSHQLSLSDTSIVNSTICWISPVHLWFHSFHVNLPLTAVPRPSHIWNMPFWMSNSQSVKATAFTPSLIFDHPSRFSVTVSGTGQSRSPSQRQTTVHTEGIIHLHVFGIFEETPRKSDEESMQTSYVMTNMFHRESNRGTN